jgi:hypothetical protein
MSNYQQTKNILTPYVSDSLTKVRYGNINDGGYIFSKELIESCNSVYSYGIGVDKEGINFDLQMASLDKIVFMRDGSVCAPPINHSNFKFEKVFCDSDNFFDHLSKNNHLQNKNLIAQIDIEGSEWEMFKNCKEECLIPFSQICVEFHDVLVENYWQMPSLCPFKEDIDRKNLIFSKILKSHYVYHIHANNHSYCSELPNVMEITFIRKDIVPDFKQESIAYPIKNMDFPCNPERIDYPLDWWI